MGKRKIILKACFSFSFLLLAFVLPEAVQSEDVQVTQPENPEVDFYLKTTLDAYAKLNNCDVSDLDTSSLSSLKGICQSVKDSPLCENIEPKYLLNCDNIFIHGDQYFNLLHFGAVQVDDAGIDIERESYKEGSVMLSSLGTSWDCLKGLGTGILDILGVALAILQGAAAGVTELFMDAEWSTEILNNIGSFGHYFMIEYDREVVKGESNFPMLAAVWNMIRNALAQEYAEFGCLSAEGKNKVVCQVVTDAAAIVVTGGAAAALGAGKAAISAGIGVGRAAVFTAKSPFLAVSKTIQGVRKAGRVIKDKNPVGSAARYRRRANRGEKRRAAERDKDRQERQKKDEKEDQQRKDEERRDEAERERAKDDAEVKKAEADARKAEADAQKADADQKKARADAVKARADARKAEAEAKARGTAPPKPTEPLRLPPPKN